MIQELRQALRSLTKSPGFVALAVITLALGIGATAAIFTLLDQVSLRLIPVKDPQQLTMLRWEGTWRGSNTGYAAWSYPWYQDLVEDGADVFEEVFCRRAMNFSFGFGGENERINGEFVSGNYFRALGVGAQRGRVIMAADDEVDDAAPVAVLSHDFWRNRFNSDPAAVGQTIRLNGNPFEVIGVAQPGFQGIDFASNPQVFVPTAMKKTLSTGFHKTTYIRENRRGRWLNVFARLKPGITREQAHTQLATKFAARIEEEIELIGGMNEYSQARWREVQLELLPGGQGPRNVRGQLEEPLWALMAMVGLLLLIACANIANLLVARASGRTREIAIRLAMGSGRGRIIRQLLMESCVLAFLGAAGGLMLAYWITSSLLAFLPEGGADLMLTAEPDMRIFAFTAGLALITALAFGLAPALQTSSVRLASTLKDQGGSVVGGHFGMRRVLAGAQIFLSLVLLVGAGLFLRTVNHLQSLDPGMNTADTLVFGVEPLKNGYDQPRMNVFLRRLRAEAAAIPGVESSGVALLRVLDGDNWQNSIWVDGYEASDGENMNPSYNAVSPGYFATLGVPLLQGRAFTEADTAEAHKVGVVNEAFAKYYFGDESPIGRTIGFFTEGRPPIEIVGLIPDVRYENMIEEIPRQVFIPYDQNPWAGEAHVFARTSMAPEAAFAQLRAKVRELDATLPIFRLSTMKAQLEKTIISQRLTAFLATSFGVLATLLSAIGLYGLLAYTVTRRTREIGLRVAMGAQKSDVVWLILSEVVKIFAIGAILALGASLALSRLLASQLYGVEPWDPVNMIAATVILALVALAAGYLPAFRAAKTDPMQALRFE